MSRSPSSSSLKNISDPHARKTLELLVRHVRNSTVGSPNLSGNYMNIGGGGGYTPPTPVIPPTSGFTNPMTTLGDMIYGGTAGLPTRLEVGDVGDIARVNASFLPEWVTFTHTHIAGDGGDLTGYVHLAGDETITGTKTFQNTSTSVAKLICLDNAETPNTLFSVGADGNTVGNCLRIGRSSDGKWNEISGGNSPIFRNSDGIVLQTLTSISETWDDYATYGYPVSQGLRLGNNVAGHANAMILGHGGLILDRLGISSRYTCITPASTTSLPAPITTPGEILRVVNTAASDESDGQDVRDVLRVDSLRMGQSGNLQTWASAHPSAETTNAARVNNLAQFVGSGVGLVNIPASSVTGIDADIASRQLPVEILYPIGTLEQYTYIYTPDPPLPQSNPTVEWGPVPDNIDFYDNNDDTASSAICVANPAYAYGHVTWPRWQTMCSDMQYTGTISKLRFVTRAKKIGTASVFLNPIPYEGGEGAGLQAISEQWETYIWDSPLNFNGNIPWTRDYILTHGGGTINTINYVADSTTTLLISEFHIEVYGEGIDGQLFAPTTSSFVVRTPSPGLSNEQALSTLSTGLVKNTTTTGVLSIATKADLPSHDHSTTGEGGTGAVPSAHTHAAVDVTGTAMTLVSDDTITGLKTFDLGIILNNYLAMNGIDSAVLQIDLHDTVKNSHLYINPEPMRTAVNTNCYVPAVNGSLLVAGSSPDPAATLGAISKVNRVGQTASITSNKLTNASPAGFYLVSASLACTIAAVGSVTFNLVWTDDAGAVTDPLLTVNTATVTRGYANKSIYLASGDITWTTTRVGTATYALRVRAVYLGA